VLGHSAHDPFELEAFACPACDAGAGVDQDTLAPVVPRRLGMLSAWAVGQGRYRLAVGAAEAQLTAWRDLGCVATFVDETVVVAAELDEVGQVGGPSVGPLLEVVGV